MDMPYMQRVTLPPTPIWLGFGSMGNRRPLQDKLLFHGNDVEAMAAHIGDVIRPHQLQVQQRIPKEVNAAFCHAPLSQISVSYLEYGFKSRVQTEQLGAYLLEVPLSGRSHTRCADQSADSRPGLAVIAGPEGAFSTDWSEDCSKLLIKISRQALQDKLNELLGHPANAALHFDMEVDFNSDGGRSLLAVLQMLMSELENPNSLLHSAPLAHNQYEQMLVWALLHAQPHNFSAQLQQFNGFHTPHHVRRVVDYIERYCSEAISLDDLIGISGVGERTLFAAFKQYKQCSPMKYLKKVRMEKVYQALRAASPEDHSVTELAEHWGFSQLGRFSVEYRQRYGESPSETLKRSAAAGPASAPGATAAL